MFMHKPKSKGKLERRIDHLAKSFDRWFDNRQKKLKERYGEADTELEDMLRDTLFEINEMLGFKSDPENLKRFIK